MTPQEFFHQAIGTKLGIPEKASVKSQQFPHRVASGVKPLSLGQLDCFYIAASDGPSQLIGRIQLPPIKGLEVIDTEQVSARKHLANWLLTHAAPPYMVGMIGKAHPEPSFRISPHLALTQLCDTGGNQPINVELAREGFAKIADLPWKQVVAPAIHCYERYLQAPRGANAAQLKKLLDKTPSLRKILPTLGIRPNSGEYSLLSWANIE
ncbi:hypothetical protein [Parachitinimonas caeni]|uniref:Uncharacterized protein n=1 Tax=Parachitinimonas caeni TaxID=3031301 RepID=A0ABT7E1Q8_9NEIS|nr:hypothetical protein [Parachitinimonas caeni]MDK2126244.1 hypothetical protein [Parachitinimonas caeni]